MDAVRIWCNVFPQLLSTHPACKSRSPGWWNFRVNPEFILGTWPSRVGATATDACNPRYRELSRPNCKSNRFCLSNLVCSNFRLLIWQKIKVVCRNYLASASMGHSWLGHVCFDSRHAVCKLPSAGLVDAIAFFWLPRERAFTATRVWQFFTVRRYVPSSHRSAHLPSLSWGSVHLWLRLVDSFSSLNIYSMDIPLLSCLSSYRTRNKEHNRDVVAWDEERDELDTNLKFCDSLHRTVGSVKALDVRIVFLFCMNLALHARFL